MEQVIEFFRVPATHAVGSHAYYAELCRRLQEASGASGASVWLADEDGGLHMAYGTNVELAAVKDIVLRKGEGISGASVLCRKAIHVDDASETGQHDSRIDQRVGFQTKAMIAAPLVWNAQVLGAINLLNPRNPDSFRATWPDRLSSVAVMLAAAIGDDDRCRHVRPAARKSRGSAIVGVSPTIRRAFALCVKAGSSILDVPVLITGETGTGKELAAKRIHEAGFRNGEPLVAINCAAVSESLLESELFGHRKGAFTGATSDRKGKFLTASGGTLFLDEVAELPLPCQAKILRALEDKAITPLGADIPVSYNARIIAATHCDLAQEVREGRFREDLYYRLCGIEIYLPPLRERREDILALANHFLEEASTHVMRLSPDALARLEEHPWPGNVRQLRQAVRAAAAVCDGEMISHKNLPRWVLEVEATFHPSISQEERRIRHALDATRYPSGRTNKAAAARLLEMPRKTLDYRIHKFGIE